MKKLILIASCIASMPVFAVPTYEPFTEYAAQIAASGSNCLDLCTGGLTAPGGESWGSLNYSGFGLSSPGNVGLDVLVTNNSSSPFTSNALSSILPSTFPGFPASAIYVTAVNPAQPGAGATTVGNSAVLIFANDFTRPASGTKTLYVSYLVSFAQKGQLGTQNDGRYLAFFASSNLVEPSIAYPYWGDLFNTFGGSACYAAHGLLDINTTNAYLGPCDCSAGKDFSTSIFKVPMGTATSPGAPVFVVGAYTFNANGQDTNSVWVNPGVNNFGGAIPPATLTSQNDVIPSGYTMSDLGGLCLIDRIGSGAMGGMGTNYIANLIIGTTWSYVTGGPEFTNQPSASVPILDNGNASLSAVALAAGQSVNYQWQKVTAGTTNNLTDTAGSAGGSAIVSDSATTNLTLTGVTAGDLGTYQLLATASGTGYTLASSQTLLVPVADPYISSQPQPVQANYGSAATFSAVAETTSGSLTYQWYNATTPLSNGTQPDGSSISGASDTVTGNSLSATLTLSGVTWQERGDYILWVTNAQNATASSTPATLTVNDPYIVSQPVSSLTLNTGLATNITFVASGTGVTYQWYETNSGAVTNGGDISGATTTNLTFYDMTLADAGTYYAVASGPGGSVQSSNVAITVLPITIQPPAYVTVPPGGTTNIAVGVAGAGLTYQWYNTNSEPLSNTGDFSGVTTSNLTIANAQSGDAGVYYLVVTWPNGTEQSTPVVLYVNNDNAQLISISVPAGTQVMPRTIFTQTWTVQNIGSTTWTPGQYGYTLKLIGTDSLGAIPLYTNISYSWFTPSAIIGSGESVGPSTNASFSMSFIAPEAVGPVSDTFQLFSANGVAFGPEFTVQIVVPQAGSTNQFDRSKAISYANNYAGFVVSDGYFWTDGSDYAYFGALAPVPTNPIGDDCAHFVSCCIGSQPNQWGGGLNIPSRVPPTYGEPGVARLINTCLIAPGYATEVFSLSNLSPGDLIGWNWEGDTNIEDLDHVTLYLGNGLLASHAVSALDFSTTTFSQNGGPVSVSHFIHIFDAPTITSSVIGTNLVLSWGTNWTGYALYSGTNLYAGATWTRMSNSPVVVGASNIVVDTMSQGALFYRLMLP